MSPKAKEIESSVSRLISFEHAARLMGGLHPNTLRQRKAGTESLTHVPGFGRRVFLIRSEVEALVTEKMNQAIRDDRECKRLIGVSVMRIAVLES